MKRWAVIGKPISAGRRVAALFGEALQEFGTHDGPWLAGAIAYYASFSVFPLLLVLLAVFGLLMRVSPAVKDAQQQLLGLVAQNTTPQLASQVAAVLAGVNLDATISGPLGLVVLLLGASGLFAALDGAFDRLWDVPAPLPGVLPTVRMLLYQRLNAFLMLLALGLLVVVAFSASLVLAAAGRLAAQLPAGQFGWQIVQVFISVGIDTGVLAVIYKVLPKPDLHWRDVWFGALTVAIVWEIGKQILAWLVIGQNYTAYGVVGAFIALMAWIYYASLLFFVGAELVRVSCRARERQPDVGQAPAIAQASAIGQASAVGRAPVAGQAPALANTGGAQSPAAGPAGTGQAAAGAPGKEPEMKTGFNVLKNTFKEWSEDKASRLAAALAYYTIFSIAPLLIVVIGIAGLVFGKQAVQGQIEGQIRGLVGPQGAGLIQTMIASASKPSAGIIATVIGVVTLLLGASGVFGQLQDALNTIWEVTPRPGRKIWAVLRDRLLTFGMVLGIGFLLIVSLVVSAALSALSGAAARLVPVGVPVMLWQIVNLAVSFVVITLLFALIFKFLPDVRISWRDVWAGALFTSLLFTIGKYLIGLYLGHSSATSAYGAAGSLVLILLWIYYSAQILFLGAEFTQVYARRYGTRIEPARDAIPLTEEARAQQGIPHAAQLSGTGSATEPAGAEPSGTQPAPRAGAAQERVRRPAARPAGLPSRVRMFAASSDQSDGRVKGLAAAAAGAVLFAVVAVTRLGRKP